MDEQEWLTTKNFDSLRYLAFPRQGFPVRKLRLTACAITRTVAHLATDNRVEQLLELAEAAANEEATHAKRLWTFVSSSAL